MISGATQASVAVTTAALDEAALARHLRFANSLTDLLKPGLAMDRRVAFENSQRELKLSLMRAGWQLDWGDRAAFETWVLHRRGEAPSRAALALWDTR